MPVYDMDFVNLMINSFIKIVVMRIYIYDAAMKTGGHNG